jgi:hypothetical protein
MLARSAISPRRKNAGRPAEKSAPGFLKWLRGRPCAFSIALNTEANCHGKMEAAHTPGGGDKGMGTKCSDRYAVPLCSSHHRSQHDKGWPFYQRLLEIDAKSLAEDYWRAWPGRAAWERALEEDGGR